jgi:hypothetical protein
MHRIATVQQLARQGCQVLKRKLPEWRVAQLHDTGPSEGARRVASKRVATLETQLVNVLVQHPQAVVQKAKTLHDIVAALVARYDSDLLVDKDKKLPRGRDVRTPKGGENTDAPAQWFMTRTSGSTNKSYVSASSHGGVIIPRLINSMMRGLKPKDVLIEWLYKKLPQGVEYKSWERQRVKWHQAVVRAWGEPGTEAARLVDALLEEMEEVAPPPPLGVDLPLVSGKCSASTLLVRHASACEPIVRQWLHKLVACGILSADLRSVDLPPPSTLAAFALQWEVPLPLVQMWACMDAAVLLAVVQSGCALCPAEFLREPVELAWEHLGGNSSPPW